MNDITVIDLFWLILKFLVALGLVGLIGLALFLAWVAAKRAAKTSWDILRGRNTSVTAITVFSIAVVIFLSVVILAVGYLNDHPNFLHKAGRGWARVAAMASLSRLLLAPNHP